MVWEGFIGPSYVSQSPLADAERLVNWYPEQIESPFATAQVVFYPTPGTRDWATVTDVGCRALFSIDNVQLAVLGSSLYRIGVGPVLTKIGTVATDNNLAYAVTNGTIGNQALIGAGGNGYNLDLPTNTLTAIANLSGKVFQVGMLDGWMVAFDATSGTMRLSNHEDNTTWDPTQFAIRQAPDQWRAMIIVPPDIWLLGQQSGDVWYDAGAAPFPFAPRQINFKYGIAAPQSLAAIGPTVLWLAQTSEGEGMVVRTNAYQPQRISTYAVETAIAQYQQLGSLSAVEGMTYLDRGHPFYCLRFPAADATWVYDLAMGTWHERGYWNPARNQYEAWRPRVHALIFDQHIVGDAQTGVLQVLDANVGLERDGSVIRRLRRAPALFNEMQQIPIRVIELYLETGTAPIAIAGMTRRDGRLMWRTSDDGGRTWGNERQATVGSRGETRVRVRFWRNGTPRDRVGELTVSDPIPWRVISCYINNDGSGA